MYQKIYSTLCVYGGKDLKNKLKYMVLEIYLTVKRKTKNNQKKVFLEAGIRKQKEGEIERAKL